MKDSTQVRSIHFVATGGHPLPPFALELALAAEGTEPHCRASVAHDLEALTADVTQNREGKTFALFVPSCSEFVQLGLSQGGTPAATVQLWCVLADRVLKLRRRHREGVVLLPLAAAADPQNLVKALNRHLSVELPSPETPAAPIEGRMAGEDAFLRLVAELVRFNHPEAEPLAAELEASSLSVDTAPAPSAAGYGEDVDLLFRRESEARTAREMNFAETRSVLAELRQELAERTAELKELRGTVASLSCRRDKLESKNVWLRGELATARSKAEKATERSRVAEAELAALRASRSWRIMAPARAVSMRLRRS